MHPCPHCPKPNNQTDLQKYGFTLYTGAKYWTIIKEIKACCPIKVELVDHNSATVTVEVNGKQFSKSRKEFMETSWRDIDSY